MEAFRDSGNQALSSRIAGVSRETVRIERRRNEEFEAAYKDAIQDAVELVDAELRRRATVGTPTTKTTVRKDKDGNVIEEVTTSTNYISTAAAIAFLKAHHPAYREQWRIEHVGDGGGPIALQVERERTPERLEELLRIASELGWAAEPIALPPGRNGN